jgi:hypothetical protein
MSTQIQILTLRPSALLPVQAFSELPEPPQEHEESLSETRSLSLKADIKRVGWDVR